MTHSLSCDIGVQLLYYLYGKKVPPDIMSNITHELVKESQVLYYLTQKGLDIKQVASALYIGDKSERS